MWDVNLYSQPVIPSYNIHPALGALTYGLINAA